MDHSLAWHREPISFTFLKKGIAQTVGPGFGLFEKPLSSIRSGRTTGWRPALPEAGAE
ncbi:MAG: hypothetical protein L6W00_22105 [Lentisphaeria bacterium]|nr:MAG: hypothetical protein L6W00_22105 [Lentisphaeria bacterium]